MARLAPFCEAVWLVGSAAMDAFEPGRSDLDLMAVAPAGHELEIARELSHRSLPVPARKLELVVYTREGLRERRFSLNLNTGEDEPEHVGLDPDAEASFWFTIDLAIAREHGRSLWGPVPADLIPEIPADAVRAAIRESVEWHRRERAAHPDAVLNAARALRWLEEGVWSSKPEAAAWLLDHVGRRTAG